MSELDYENYRDFCSRRKKEREINSPIPGMVRRIYKNAGDKIKENEIVAIIECMKTYVEIRSKEDGTVTEVLAKENKFIERSGTILKYVVEK